MRSILGPACSASVRPQNEKRHHLPKFSIFENHLPETLDLPEMLKHVTHYNYSSIHFPAFTYLRVRHLFKLILTPKLPD